jgi:4'-phosphopantetheinyl transferase EntD
MKELIIIKSGENPDLEKLWMEKAQAKMSRFHPNRQKEWVNGRVALTLAFKSLSIDITPASEFLGYQQIKGHEEFFFSISHTGEWAGALLVKGIKNPGLDIENKTREIDENVLERFSHPGDHTLEALLLWSVKEAAYKTLPKEIQEKIWLQSIQVGAGTFSGEGFSGHWRQCEHPELMIVEAFR